MTSFTDNLRGLLLDLFGYRQDVTRAPLTPALTPMCVKKTQHNWDIRA